MRCLGPSVLGSERTQGERRETNKKQQQQELAKTPKLKPNQTESSWGGGSLLIEDVYNIYGL
jgi:hypothetical protein